ncbi:hypothetical protein EW146_g9434 [Bondarzewia mesenterica]|uniref:DUF6532 domain-containing protein n=1 Tax=Bondarzewia mesenterica TaxID=1095465 RepID=A0A4S4L6C7_9AGAM|nr:hypothetical protein EW146_g9434 [Bondarzewia mesenterica]
MRRTTIFSAGTYSRSQLIEGYRLWYISAQNEPQQSSETMAQTDTSRRTYAEVASPRHSKTSLPPLVNQERNLPSNSSSTRATAVNPRSQEKENVSTRTQRERRPSEKVVANRDEQEEAAHRQEILAANRVERAKRAERKRDKANGIDRPAESDDDARPDSAFISKAVVTKPAAQKALTLVQRRSKVPPPAPAQIQQSQPLLSHPTEASSSSVSEPHDTAQHRFADTSQSPSHYRSRSPADHTRHSRHLFRSHSRSHSRSDSRHRGRHAERSPAIDEDFHDMLDLRNASPPRSRSQSLTTINDQGKRGRSPEDEAIAEISASCVKAQKITENGGRPKASDYDDVAKEVILTATGIYRCLISTLNAFPTPSEEAQFIRIAWDRANEETAQKVPIFLSPVIAKVDLSNKSGLYQHPIVQKIANKSWFNNPRDEGIAYADLFDLLSVEAIALILTAIECGIDAWATGCKIEVPFYGTEYKPLYGRHVKTLKAFWRLDEIHAGVSSTISKDGPMLSESAFAAALKEYEEDSETEEEGDDLD